MRSSFFATIAVALLCISSSAAAQGAPEQISFQGYVTDPGGTPINHPGVNIRFRLFEGSSQIWRETQQSVKIVDGVFNVRIGSVIPLDTVSFNRPLFLRIKVGSDAEVSPHTPLASAAYALGMRGLYAVQADNATNSSYNVIAGASNNVVASGVVGGTIGGGGGVRAGSPVPNSVLGDFATVGGGRDNTADGRATVGGPSNFVSTRDNQFLIRAAGGVGINTNATVSSLTIQGFGDNSEWITFRDRLGVRQWHLNYLSNGLNFAESTIADARLYLEDGGNVGIGTSNPTQKLEVNGNALANAHTTPSDRRLKRNIQPVSNSLDTVIRLSGVSYEWRTDEYPDREFDEGRHIGSIAQDVESVVPEAIRVGSDGTYTMRYQEIIPILVEAIKEQQQTIDEQRGVIARFDDRLTALEASGTN